MNSRPKDHALVSICVSPFFPYAIEETDFQMITTDYFNVMIAENSLFFPVLIKVHNCPDYECMKFCVQSLLTHSMSSSCGTCTKEIWAAFFWQTIWAGLERFLAASPIATVQVNREKVKPNILSLIFCSWKSL